MSKPKQLLKMAEKGAILSIIAYILLVIIKVYIGSVNHSESMVADGWNNFTDILSNCFILIGLKASQIPSDEDHRYGHWKMENIASLITSIIMFIIGISVLIAPIKKIILHQTEHTNILSGFVGILTGIFMYFIYRYNYKLAKKVKSQALMASAKDNLSDVFSSFGAGIASCFSAFGFYILDNITAIIIGIIIIKSAFDIFKQSTFALSDGFDQNLLSEYTKQILTIKGIDEVRHIRGRMYGNLIYVDVVVCINPNMTVKQSHDLTEDIERLLTKNCDVYHTEVHVEPTDYT